LKEFWKRFEAEYLSQQKPATQKNYSTAWCRYIRPILGDLPLDAIDREAVGKLRAKLGKMKPQSRNELLGNFGRPCDRRRTGPFSRRLRHACLTILAGRGTDPYRLQAHARHSRLSTTQKYIHLAREQAALEAAAM
jgi:hypothetical protein